MDYMIIVGESLSELQANVSVLCLNKRWEPQGGAFFDPRTNLYCQPAVREINNGTKEN